MSTSRRAMLIGGLVAGSAAVAAPAEAAKWKPKPDKCKPPKPAPAAPVSQAPTPVLLNPPKYQDEHRASSYYFGEFAYVGCELPARYPHDTCEAHLSGGAKVTWTNQTV